MSQIFLDDVLRTVVDHCYFKPPANISMHYPCIVYEYNADADNFADNKAYTTHKRYTVTVIDPDPDSKIPSRLKESLLYCKSDRNFKSNGLNHFVYTLYYNGPRIKEDDYENYQMG